MLRWITSAGNLGHTPTTVLGSLSVPVQRQAFSQRRSTFLFWKDFPISIPKEISGMSILPQGSWPTRWRTNGGEINCSPPAWKVQEFSLKAWPGTPRWVWLKKNSDLIISSASCRSCGRNIQPRNQKQMFPFYGGMNGSTITEKDPWHFMP